MRLLTQTAIQPEAIGVIVVLVVAAVSLVVVGVALARSRRRRREREQAQRGDQPDAARFEGQDAVEVIGTADQALYDRDGRTVAAAALHLHAAGNAQALPYLLHALRLAPVHHRPRLLNAAAEHDAAQLAEHPLLAAAIDPDVLDSLRDAVQARQQAGEPVASGRQRRRR